MNYSTYIFLNVCSKKFLEIEKRLLFLETKLEKLCYKKKYMWPLGVMHNEV